MNTCAICLDEIAIEREVRLDSCSHKYCGQCITQWVEEVENVCPLCKKKVTKIIAKDVLGRPLETEVKEKKQEQEEEEELDGIYCETCGYEVTEANFDHSVALR